MGLGDDFHLASNLKNNIWCNENERRSALATVNGYAEIQN